MPVVTKVDCPLLPTVVMNFHAYAHKEETNKSLRLVRVLGQRVVSVKS